LVVALSFSYAKTAETIEMPFGMGNETKRTTYKEQSGSPTEWGNFGGHLQVHCKVRENLAQAKVIQ